MTHRFLLWVFFLFKMGLFDWFSQNNSTGGGGSWGGSTNTIPNYNNAANNYVSTDPTLNKYASSTTAWPSSPYNPVNQSGGGNSGSGGDSPAPQPAQPSGPSPEEIYKQQQISNISNKWNGYFSTLDNILGGLPGQADTLKSTANIQAGQSVNDLTASTDQSKADLYKSEDKINTNQVKSLKDISSNIRNLMQAGNTYLGAKGAGDSSAVNQYAYALTKLGSQQRGDVTAQTNDMLNDVNDRLSKVNNVYTQEKQRIDSELNIQINNIASWLATQQQAIQQAKAQGQLDKGTDIQALTENLYNIAVQKATQLQNVFQDQQAALQTWALNNSNSLKEAQSKLGSYGSFQVQAPSYGAINGTPQFGTQPTNSFYGGGGSQSFTDEEKKALGLA